MRSLTGCQNGNLSSQMKKKHKRKEEGGKKAPRYGAVREKHSMDLEKKKKSQYTSTLIHNKDHFVFDLLYFFK